MLGWRLAVSAVLIPVLIGIFVLDHKAGGDAPYLFALACLLAVRSNFELNKLLTIRQFRPAYWPTTYGCVAIVGGAWIGQLQLVRGMSGLEGVLLTFALGVLALFFKACWRYREPGRNLETLAAEIFSLTYVGVLLGITAQLRWVPDVTTGYLALASVVIVPKCGDIGAYTLGRLFGRRKMVPLLSPGKTWAGAGGALLGACLGSWLWLCVLGPMIFDSAAAHAISVSWVVLYGTVLGVVGLVGDLAESLIKRDVGAKDAAALMPGFGGLLDLLDSVLYSGPVALLLWRFAN